MAVVFTAALALMAPAGAAAARPAVTTGTATSITQTTATLSGTVDANRRATSYFFEYGPTRAYGSVTPAAAAGSAGAPVRVEAAVGALTPFTRYHFRLVAVNADGQARGGRRVLRTLRVPLGLSLTATPSAVLPGQGLVLSGVLSGTGNAGRAIRLQWNVYPYLSGWAPYGNPLLTDANGAFSFPVLSLPGTAAFQVYVDGASEIASAPLTVGLAVRVTSRTRRVRRYRRSASIRFFGRVYPARDGVQVAVQRLRRGTWVTVKRTFARHATASYSRYRTRVRVRRRGLFRVAAFSEGQYTGNVGRTIRIRPRRR
jgi:hypothetical protein